MTDSNGLYYMRARYYSPELKRFINADVVAGDISNAITLNRYAYANGNPVLNIDPFGLCPQRGVGQVRFNDEWYDIFVPPNGAYYENHWEYVDSVYVQDLNFDWASFLSGVELDDYNGYLTGDNANGKYVSNSDILKMGVLSVFGSILSGLNSSDKVYLKFVFEKFNDSKRVKILVGSTERAKLVNSFADGFSHGLHISNHGYPFYQALLSKEIGKIYKFNWQFC